MPGFFISNLKGEYNLNNLFNDRCCQGYIENKNYSIYRNTLNKFLNDKLFISDEEHVIIIEGVILNKKELIGSYREQDFASTVKRMIFIEGELFFNKFRGCFSGALYEKKENKWIIYTNHVGDKPIFYYHANNVFITASSVDYIIEALKQHGISYELNVEAVYDMLTYGFMASGRGDGTFIKEIKRLSPGHCIKYSDGKLEVLEYYRFTNTSQIDDRITETEIIELIDDKFRRAIRLEYEKDLEYGYKHVTTLSGGLDSRMNAWVAKALGYCDMLNVTFSQSNYLDEFISKEISNALNTELIIKTLDDAKCLLSLTKIIQMNHGLSIYSGIAHGKSMFDYINFDKLGLLHTGQLGDSIIGSALKDPIFRPISKAIGLYSSLLINKIDISSLSYENEEIYFLYTRCFNGALCSHIAHSNYTEIVSPFLDVDFLEFCLSIPIKLRVKHYIYKKWILKKYPDAAKFKWEKIDAKITENEAILFIKKMIKKGPKKMLKMLGLNIKASCQSMNPFDYWYEMNYAIKEYMDNYYKANLNNKRIDDVLVTDMKFMYESGTASEKTQVLTVLATINYYFGE